MIENVSAVAAALAIVPMMVLVLRRGVDLPYWDEWGWTSLIVDAHRHALTLTELWIPHNEHRIFVANLVMVALDTLGGWNVVREQAVSLVVLCATQLFIWLLIRRTIPPSRRGVAFLAITLLLYGLVQEENLRWGFQMAWFICNLGLVVAVWALVRPNRAWWHLALAIAAATVASLSSTQGLVVWAAGLIALSAVPRRLAVSAAIWAGTGVVVWTIARSGTSNGSLPHGGLGDLVTMVGFSLTYLGAPLVRSFGPVAAMIAGVAVIAALAFIAVLALHGGLGLRTRLLPWLAIAAYPLLCAPMTSFGRASGGVGAAEASRYTSISSLGWIAVIAAVFIVAPRWRDRRASNVAWSAVALVVFLSLLQSYAGNGTWVAAADQLRTARADLVVANSHGLAPLFPDNRAIVTYMGWLYAVGDGPFSAR